MLKRVLSIALFLTLILSLVPMANAAEGDAQVKVAYVAIANHDPSDNAAIAINPPNAYVGLLTPGLADNTLTIKGKWDVMKSREFDIIVVFDGVLKKDEGWLWLNNNKVDVSNAKKYIVGEDESWSAIEISYKLDDVPNVFFTDWGSSQTYKIDIAQDLGKKVTSKYQFTVKYIDAEPKPEDLIGNVSTSILTQIGNIQMAFNYSTNIITPEVDPIEDGDVDVVYGLVNASVLNLRSAPNGSIIGKLASGTAVAIVEVEGNWYTVVTENEQVGYVYAKYITPVAYE